MEGMTVQTAMNFAAIGIGLGSAIFSWLGIHLERDFFLMMGLLACCLGNLAFTAYLWEQGVAGERRDAMVTVFLGFFLLTLYATYCQCVEWYEEGWAKEEGEEEEEVEEAQGGQAEGKVVKEEGEEEEEEEEEEVQGAAANAGLSASTGVRRR